MNTSLAIIIFVIGRIRSAFKGARQARRWAGVASASVVLTVAAPVAASPLDMDEVPAGYTRDEQGRVFQTSFDLRRRLHLGVYGLQRFDGPEGFGASEQSLVIDTSSVYTDRNVWVGVEERWAYRNHRHRFLQARLVLAPLEIDAMLYSFDSVATSSGDASIWITTFIGEPRRFDVPLRLGAGMTLGRLHYRRTDAGNLMLLNLLDARVNLEFYEGANREDFAQFHMGVGGGIRHLEGTGAALFYAYPEVGLEAAWVLGARGLTHVGLNGRMQWGWEPATGRVWSMGTAGAWAERVVLAINDQPISLFVEPTVRYTRIEVAGLDGLDYRFLAGGRLSFFTPPRPSPPPPSEPEA